jgi:hypothetical protein
MSDAGGLSYNSLQTNRRVTLPSVESWGANMNILKDPPKSITTRKIDKVFQNMNIVEEIDRSGDRIQDAINIYARGVNPSVAVSYSNYGTNGGQNRLASGKSGKITACSNSNNKFSNATLPYKSMNAGAFRPPVIPWTQKFPYSRLPTVYTYAKTTPLYKDIKTSMYCKAGGASAKQAINESIFHTEVQPTQRMIIEKSNEKIDNVGKYITNNHYNGDLQTIKGSYETSPLELVKIPRAEPVGSTGNPVQGFAQTNFGTQEGTNSIIDYNIIDKRQFINETIPQAKGFTNVTKNIFVDWASENQEKAYKNKIKDKFNLQVDSSISQPNCGDYGWEGMVVNHGQSRNLPVTTFDTHRPKSVHKIHENSEHKLGDTLKGGIEPMGTGTITKNFVENINPGYSRQLSRNQLQEYAR